MLPERNDPDFPNALRSARISKNLNMKELAHMIGIHGAMIGRYEDINHSWHSHPSQKTWEKLNNALFGDSNNTVTNYNNGDTIPLQSEKSLKNASIEEIVRELRKRGAVSVEVRFAGM